MFSESFNSYSGHSLTQSVTSRCWKLCFAQGENTTIWWHASWHESKEITYCRNLNLSSEYIYFTQRYTFHVNSDPKNGHISSAKMDLLRPYFKYIIDTYMTKNGVVLLLWTHVLHTEIQNSFELRNKIRCACVSWPPDGPYWDRRPLYGPLRLSLS